MLLKNNSEIIIEKPKAILISGPLGSGKTTLINNLLPNFGENTKIIVNDIGMINIDSTRINSENKVSLEHGCVCCEDLGAFEDEVKKIAEENKNGKKTELIIEPSGIAEVSSIKNVLKKYGFDTTILTLGDGKHHEIRSDEERRIEENQLKEANFIGLTWKNQEEKQEEFLKFIEKINPKAKIFDIIYSENQEYFSENYTKFYENLWEELKELNLSEEVKKNIFAFNSASFNIVSRNKGFSMMNNSKTHSLDTFSKKINISEETIKNLFETLGNKLIRAKGVLANGREFDIVHGNLNFGKKINSEGFLNIITEKNIYNLLDESKNDNNSKLIEEIKENLISGENFEEKSENKVFEEKYLDFNLSEEKIEKLIKQFEEYMLLEEDLGTLKEKLNSKEDMKNLLNSINKLQLKQKNLGEDMKYDNPYIWIIYKLEAYKNSSSEINTVGDFIEHCHKNPTYICGKRFNFLNKILKEKYDLDFKKLDKNILLENVLENGFIQEISKDKDLMNIWLNYEYFEENKRVAKWENYKK